MIRQLGDGVALDILVSPRASRARIGPVHGDRLKVAVTSPPVDGAANKAIVELFATALRIGRRQVEVRTGQASRRKTVHIAGVTADAVEELWS